MIMMMAKIIIIIIMARINFKDCLKDHPEPQICSDEDTDSMRGRGLLEIFEV